LLATVRWVVQQLGVSLPDTVVTTTYAWNDCKLRFSPRQIRLAQDVLQSKGWLSMA
jgi:hypothetical protein